MSTRIPSNQILILIQDVDSDELSKLDTITDVRYQDITYYMCDRNKTVKSESVDFFKAISEMEKIDWEYTPNYIGFTNNTTKENVQLVREEQDKWYAEILIKHDDEWKGYVWCCHSEFKAIENMLKLFFEETAWSETLSWKLKRIGKYAND